MSSKKEGNVVPNHLLPLAKLKKDAEKCFLLFDILEEEMTRFGREWMPPHGKSFDLPEGIKYDDVFPIDNWSKMATAHNLIVKFFDQAKEEIKADIQKKYVEVEDPVE